jgi:hypothetical protein
VQESGKSTEAVVSRVGEAPDSGAALTERKVHLFSRSHVGAWRKTAKWKRRRIALLIGRDGHACWLCTRPLSRHSARPGRRVSLEHLTPRSAGGGDGLDNLVLCHAACNRHLGDRPADRKLKIREKWHREAKRQAAACQGRSSLAPGSFVPGTRSRAVDHKVVQAA